MWLRRVLVAVLVAGLLVPAALVTAARVLTPNGGTWVRVVSLTPYAGLLYLLALVVLLAAWARGPGLRRTTAGLAVLALVGVSLHVWWASGPFLGGRPAASPAALHVMTSNLRLGKGDTSAVLRIAVDQAVDVLVLQEVTPRALQALRAAGVEDAYPHSAGRAEAGSRGTMVFSSTPLTRVRRLHTGFGSYAMDVRLRGTGVVHLLACHPRPPVGDAQQWWSDQRAIRAAAAGGTRPTVLAGDLNATMDHEPMRRLVADGFVDAATEARSRWQPTWPSSGEVTVLGVPVPSTFAIDHVLVDEGSRHALRPVRTRTFTVFGSDHRVLVAALDP